jgi:hypothetical protein
VPGYQQQPSERERLATLEANYENLSNTVDTLVTREEFIPVKLITYGLTGIILTSVIISLIGHLGLK